MYVIWCNQFSLNVYKLKEKAPFTNSEKEPYKCLIMQYGLPPDLIVGIRRYKKNGMEYGIKWSCERHSRD